MSEGRFWWATVGALLPIAGLGCANQSSTANSVSPATYNVKLLVDTVGDLPACSTGNDGTVAFVNTPPSLYACSAGSWNVITCSSAQAGEVAYSSSPSMLWACVASTWTAIGLPDAGPPGPTGPAGAKSLILVTNVDPGSPQCAGGGIRVDIGLDNNNDGILQSIEVLSTSYVCNGLNAGSDTGDAGDAGAVDSGSDASTLPPGLVAYPAQYAAAACTGFANCCGPTFDVAGCEAHFTTVGYDNTLPAVPVYSNGHLAFNADAGAGCLAALSAWPCGTTITGTQNAAILAACLGVLSGTIPIGGTGCTSSFECVSGSYCQPGSPTGTCIALAGDGGACSPAGESPDEQCSYIGTAQPGLYCDVYPNDGGGDGGVQLGVCAPALPDGVGSLCTDEINFYSDYACVSRGCDVANTGACAVAIANPADPAAQFECSIYVQVDAGSD